MAAHSSTLAWKILWTEEPGSIHAVAKSQIRLSSFTFTFHFHALEKEMATHSSVLAWRIPGTGAWWLPSMGLHRVGHDWSDLAAAAAAVPFFKIPYMCVNIWCLFFSFWLTSLCMINSRSVHISTNDPVSFLFMAEQNYSYSLWLSKIMNIYTFWFTSFYFPFLLALGNPHFILSVKLAFIGGGGGVFKFHV